MATINQENEIVPFSFVDLGLECPLNPRHPKIVAKKQQLKEIALKNAKIDKPVMYRKVASGIDQKMVLSHKHQLKLAADAKKRQNAQTLLQQIPKQKTELGMKSLQKFKTQLNYQIASTQQFVAALQQNCVSISSSYKIQQLSAVTFDYQPESFCLTDTHLHISQPQGFKVYDIQGKMLQQTVLQSQHKAASVTQPTYLGQINNFSICGFMQELSVHYLDPKVQTYKTQFETQISAGFSFQRQTCQTILGLGQQLKIWDFARQTAAFDKQLDQKITQIDAFQNLFLTSSYLQNQFNVLVFDPRTVEVVRAFSFPGSKAQRGNVKFKDSREIVFVGEKFGKYDFNGVEMVRYEGNSLSVAGDKVYVGSKEQIEVFE